MNKLLPIPSSSESLKTAARFFRTGVPLRLDAALPLRDRDRETGQK